jgi:hypothetical protein
MEFGDAKIMQVSALDRQQSLEALMVFIGELPPHSGKYPHG